MTPYTYLVTHIKSNKKYYGVRYAKNCHPSDLWTTYFTSSQKVKKLIDEEGPDSFTYEIRKTFLTAEAAIAWETKLLQRIKAHLNENWLNDSVGGSFGPWTPEKLAKMSNSLKGHKYYGCGEWTKERRQKARERVIAHGKFTNKGVARSAETKAIVAEKLRGRKCTKRGSKISASKIGRKRIYRDDGTFYMSTSCE